MQRYELWTSPQRFGSVARRLLVWSSLGCAGVLMNAAHSQLGFGLLLFCSWLVAEARMAVDVHSRVFAALLYR